MNDDIDDEVAGGASDDLRALWSALPAPRAGVDADGLPSEDAAAADDLTRAAVEHLRTAWAGHAVVVPELPFKLRSAHAQRMARWERAAPPLRRPGRRRALRVAGIAAAAVALILALRADRTSGDSGRAGESPVVASTGDTSVRPDTEQPRELGPSPLPTESVAMLVDIPREDFALRADGVEFETQGVRFVLIETTGDVDSSAPAEKE